MSQHGFPPYAVMVTIDIAVIAMTFGLLSLCFIKRKSIRDAGASIGVGIFVASFIPITALYAADLYTMTLLPPRIGMAAAMEAMASLHAQYSWYTYLFALFAAVCGIYLCIRAFTRQLGVQEEARSAAEKSEARLANAQRMAHLGNWEWEIEAGRATWSDEMYLIFGCQAGAIEPNFEFVNAAVHPADRDAFAENFRRACEGSHDSYEIEYRIVRSDGSQRFICSRAEIIRDETGEPVN